MYSYEDRMRAVAPYIKLGRRPHTTIRELGDSVLKLISNVEMLIRAACIPKSCYEAYLLGTSNSGTEEARNILLELEGHYMNDTVARREGPSLTLRLITPDDAAYAHGLRIDPVYNRYLSEVSGTVDDQRRWIEAYKAREAGGEEYYYVIERRKDGTRCGLVRLYDIGAEKFTWGSWILDHNKPPKAALESALLSFGIGFALGEATHALVDVRRANTHAEAFYRRMGMEELHANEQDIFFCYSRETYLRDHARHLEVLTGATQ